MNTINKGNMEREIKFRGYDKIADCWCIGTGITEDADIRGRYHLIFDDQQSVIIDDPKSIGQYTGLKDKNETEIYEGDIVQVPTFKPQGVVFKDGRFMFGDHYDLAPFIKMITILGKKYENPELLNN